VASTRLFFNVFQKSRQSMFGSCSVSDFKLSDLPTVFTQSFLNLALVFACILRGLWPQFFRHPPSVVFYLFQIFYWLLLDRFPIFSRFTGLFTVSPSSIIDLKLFILYAVFPARCAKVFQVNCSYDVGLLTLKGAHVTKMRRV
jgi:hypothetical protein